jgi:EmrB/QacA subfamily drug resistance transporter
MGLRNFPYKYLVAVSFSIAVFIDLLDITVVNVALPTIGKEFHATNDQLEWVVTGYLLSLAIWVPASGWIGDRIGTKKTFLFALSMFTLASALCGLSWNIESLVAFRILQGVGGGMLVPVGMAMLFRAFPPQERAQASAILAIPTFIAPALGPILGGWLTTDVSWRWVFYFNVPVGLFGVLFTSLYIREHREEAPGRFDPAGFVLSGTGLALVLYALSQAPDSGWTSARVLATGLGGAVLFALLVVVELRRPDPLLQFRLYGDRMFRSMTLMNYASTGSLLGVLFLLPLYLQQLRGLSALDSGLTTFPQAVGMMMVMQLTSRLYHIVGPRRLIIVGMAGSAVTTALFAFIGLATDLWWIRAILFARGASLAFVGVPMQAGMFATITPKDTGRASALSSTNRQIASAIGVALLATTLIARTAVHVPAAVTAAAQSGNAAAEAAVARGTLMAFHDAYLVAALVCVFGLACAFLIRDSDAAASMRRVDKGAEEPFTAVEAPAV